MSAPDPSDLEKPVLIRRAEEWCRHHSVSRTHFGELIANAGNFYPQFAAAKQPKIETRRKVDLFLRAFEAKLPSRDEALDWRRANAAHFSGSACAAQPPKRPRCSAAETRKLQGEIRQWLAKMDVTGGWLSRLAGCGNTTAANALAAKEVHAETAEKLRIVMRRWPDRLPDSQRPNKGKAKRKKSRNGAARDAHRALAAPSTKVKQILLPWCARTGVNLGTACQHLFGNAKILDGSATRFVAGGLPENAAELAAALVRDHPDGIDAREAALALGRDSFGKKGVCFDSENKGKKMASDKRSDRATASSRARRMPRPSLSPGATLQKIALDDPVEAMKLVQKRWPTLLDRLVDLGRDEGKRPIPMLADIIERGIEASEAAR